MPDFAVLFASEPFESLDRLALLARQDYNLGGVGDWFGDFRGGLYGFYARLYGLQRHYFEVHEWLPRVRTQRKRSTTVLSSRQLTRRIIEEIEKRMVKAGY